MSGKDPAGSCGLHVVACRGELPSHKCFLESVFLELSGEVLLGDGEDKYGKEFYRPPARISKSG